MNTALWIVAIVLAIAYLVGGLAQLLLSKERFRGISEGQHYADDYDGWFIKLIGTLKLVAVVGLVLPALVDVATWLVPLAALGLMFLMTGAATTRIMRREWRFLAGDLAFWALFGFVAWGRFGPYAL